MNEMEDMGETARVKAKVGLRKCEEKDIRFAGEILRQAVERMLAEGKQQWDKSYPNESHVRADMESGVGYVMEADGEPVAYGAIVFDGEPAYADIKGEWLTGEQESYVVVHRMAVRQDTQRIGIGMTFLKEVERMAAAAGAGSFRVDTNYDNERMLALLKKAGYSFCGKIQYHHGIRLAFEKLI